VNLSSLGIRYAISANEQARPETVTRFGGASTALLRIGCWSGVRPPPAQRQRFDWRCRRWVPLARDLRAHLIASPPHHAGSFDGNAPDVSFSSAEALRTRPRNAGLRHQGAMLLSRARW